MTTNPKRNPELYWRAVGVWGVCIVLLFLAGLIGFDFSPIVSFDAKLPVWRQIALFVSVVWPTLSVYVIKIDENAAVTFLGSPVESVGPGLKFYPWLLFKVERFSRSVQQRQFPGDPEKVFGGDDKDSLPEGMVRPLRITTGEPKRGGKSPLDVQLVLEFLYFLRIQITDPLVFKIQFGSIEEFWRQIRDTGDRVLTKKVSATPGASQLIANIDTIMEELEESFKKITEKGGVGVVETGLSSPNISHALAQAIRDIGAARARADITKIAADAEQIRLTKEGKGHAAAEEALIAAIERGLADASEGTIATYAGKQVLSDKATVLGTDGIAQAFGLGKAIVRGEN